MLALGQKWRASIFETPWSDVVCGRQNLNSDSVLGRHRFLVTSIASFCVSMCWWPRSNLSSKTVLKKQFGFNSEKNIALTRITLKTSEGMLTIGNFHVIKFVTVWKTFWRLWSIKALSSYLPNVLNLQVFTVSPIEQYVNCSGTATTQNGSQICESITTTICQYSMHQAWI